MTLETSLFVKTNQSLGGSALSITDITYLDFIVRNFKLLGIWATNGIIYPLVGSTAITHSLNLVNPANNRGTWTNDNSSFHTSNGYKPTGAVASMNTNFLPSVFGRSQTTGLYSRDAGASGGVSDFQATVSSRYYAGTMSNGNTTAIFYAMVVGEAVSGANVGATGHYTFNANAGANSIYRAGSQIASGTVTTTGVIPAANILLGNYAGSGEVSLGKQYSFFYSLPLVPATKQAVLHAIVQQGQAILGRNV